MRKISMLLVSLLLLGSGVGAAYAIDPSTTLVSQNAGGPQLSDPTEAVAMTPDGRYLAYVAGGRLFFRDRATGTIRRLTAQPLKELKDPSLSRNGEFVVFSTTSQLTSSDIDLGSDIYLQRTDGSPVILVSEGSDGKATGTSDSPTISADGSHVVFSTYAALDPADTNLSSDIYRWSGLTGTSIRVSVPDGGGVANGYSYFPSVNDTGSVVAFKTGATNLTPGTTMPSGMIAVRDLVAGTTRYVSVNSSGVAANDVGTWSTLSPDGRIVAFDSPASNLAPGEDGSGRVDVFVRNLTTGVTSRVSSTSAGVSGNGHSFRPVFGGSGRYLAFRSAASDFVSDTNGRDDAFVADLATGVITRAGLVDDGGQIPQGIEAFGRTLAVSATGRYVAFLSVDPAVTAGDTNGVVDAFLRDSGNNTAPTVSATVVRNAGTVNVDASASSDADGWITGYQWDFGDGRTSSSTTSTASHAYVYSDTYQVKVTAVDNDGASSTTTVPVTITGLPSAPSPIASPSSAVSTTPTTPVNPNAPAVPAPLPVTPTASVKAAAGGATTQKAPSLSGLKLTPKTLTATRRKAKLTLTVDQPATIQITATWRKAGKQVTATVRRTVSEAGPVKVPLTRKFGGRQLPKGKVRFTVTAKNDAGTTTAPFALKVKG